MKNKDTNRKGKNMELTITKDTCISMIKLHSAMALTESAAYHVECISEWTDTLTEIVNQEHLLLEELDRLIVRLAV
jgi:hypothetical protein